MYSQCPDCLARFRVTAAQLRAARGTVRCGRCGGAFDALTRLSDALPGTEVVDAAGLLDDESDKIAAAAESGVPPEYHFSAADLEKVFIEARDWPQPPETDLRSLEADREQESVVVDEPDRIEDITLEGEKIRIEDIEGDELAPLLLTDDVTGSPLDFDLSADLEGVDNDTTNRLRILKFVPDSAYPDDDEQLVASVLTDPPLAPAVPVRDAEPAAVAAVETDVPAATLPAASTVEARDWPLPPPPRSESPQPASASGASAAERWASAARDAPIAFEEVGDEPPHWSTDPRVWKAGTAVLALLMVAQVTHHFRDRLVRQPQIGPVIRAIYEGLGAPVVGAWDLQSFEIRQWGPDDENVDDGQLNVRASVTNRATFAQPLPLLRLEIEDRYGAAVAIRDFEPREYLKNPSRSARMLAAGEAADAELDVVAPGADAVGYRLNVCMRDTDSSVRCASTSG